jgi:hypothetical protein
MLKYPRLRRKFRTPRIAKQEAVKENIPIQVQE